MKCYGKKSWNKCKKILICLVMVIAILFIYFTGNESKADTQNQNKKPEFYGTIAINLKLNDNFTQESLKQSCYRILARDFEDGNITNKVEVTNFNVDTTRIGDYSITYKVTDSKGAETTIEVPVKVTETGKRNVHRKLYDFSDEYEQLSFLNSISYDRGNYHDKQMLGVYLKAGQKLNVKLISGELNEKLQIQLLANDSLKENINRQITAIKYLEGYGTDFDDNCQVYVKWENNSELSSEQTMVQVESKTNVVSIEKGSKNEKQLEQYSNKSFDCIPFIETPRQSKNIIIEVELTDNISSVDYYTYDDVWNKNMNNDFAILDGSRVTMLIPKTDFENVGIPKDPDTYPNDKFNSINDILEYYDDVINTYDAYIGLEDYPTNSENKNVKTKFFMKADENSAGSAAYYYRYYITVRCVFMDEFIHNKGRGWTALHEIGHGYQVLYNKRELDFVEVTNNVLAHRYQVDNLDRKLVWRFRSARKGNYGKSC